MLRFSLSQNQKLSLLCIPLLIFYLQTSPLAGARLGDFVHLWLGAHIVATGHVADLYDPLTHRELLQVRFERPADKGIWDKRNDTLGAFFYPPVAAFLLSPFGLMDVVTAGSCFALLNIVLALGLAAFMWRMLSPLLPLPATALAVFTAPPFFYSFVIGQSSVFINFLFAGSFLYWTRGRLLLSGTFACFLLIKPHWLILMGWFYLCNRSWKSLLMMTGGVFLLGLFTATFLSWSLWIEYIALLTKLFRLPVLASYPFEHQYSLLNILNKTIGYSSANTVFGLLIAGILGVVSTIRLWNLNRSDPLQSIGIGLSTFFLTSPHLHHYSPILLSFLPPLWIVWRKCRLNFLVATIWLLTHISVALPEEGILPARIPMVCLCGLVWWSLFFIESGSRSKPSESSRH